MTKNFRLTFVTLSVFAYHSRCV